MGANSSSLDEKTSEGLWFCNSPTLQEAGHDSCSIQRRDSWITENGMNCVKISDTCGFSSATAPVQSSKERKTLSESELINEKSELNEWDVDFCWCRGPIVKQRQAQNLESPRNPGNPWSKKAHSKNESKVQEQESPALRTISASDSNKLCDIESPVLRASKGIGQSHGTPSWAKEPPPLDGWSAAEQQAVMNAIHSCSPGNRRSFDHRRAAFSKLIGPGRPLDGKSVLDCEECFAHVQANRIAYFGPSHHRTSSPGHRRSSSPAHHGNSSPGTHNR